MEVRRKDVILGASIGIGIGLLLLGGIVLIARPHYEAATPPLDSPAQTTIVPPTAAAVASATPEPSSTPSPESTSSPTPIPTPSPKSLTYVVKDGDLISSIAVEHGTTVEAIKAANELTSDLIIPGEKLVIPVDDVALPTPTALTPGETVIHKVVSGETLSDLAVLYDVSVESIQSANGLTSEAIQTGQELVIPVDEAGAEASSLEPYAGTWQFSVLRGNLTAAYPLSVNTDRFTVHYQPGSLPAQRTERIVDMVWTSLNHIERTLQVELDDGFDVFVAGSLFGPPNLALRGRSFSSQRRFFFLYDGTGTPADRQYILTHENTHTVTWNTMGRPTSVMLHEGVAVYTGMTLVEDEGYLPLDSFCAAYHQIDKLPRLSEDPSFEGHIRDLETYYASGCFIQYLIETYGTAKFADLYRTGDYAGLYGQSLGKLEAEWIAVLETSDPSLAFAPEQLDHYVDEVAEAYDELFTGFSGSQAQVNAYRELDRARIALLKGRLEDVAAHLTTVNETWERE